MSTSRTSIHRTLLHCDVCMKEIPKSEAHNAEVEDYVMHFCGLECYAQWQKQPPHKVPTAKARARGNR